MNYQCHLNKQNWLGYWNCLLNKQSLRWIPNINICKSLVYQQFSQGAVSYVTMWSRVVAVVLVSCLVSSVVSFADLEDNVVPENSLQDLIVRTKKSPAEDNEKTPSQSESKSNSELKAVLTEDIKRKIDDLKELKNAYHKVEADFFGSGTLKSSTEKSSSEIILASESNNPMQTSSSESDDQSVRVARTFFSLPSSYPVNNQNLNKKYDSQTGALPNNLYSNGKYQSISSTDSSGDRDSPYIAQYNPSSRTFGATGIKGAFEVEHHKVPDIKPEVSIHTPGISIKPVDLVLPTTPVHTAPPAVNLVLPASLPTVTVSEHKPHEAAVHTTKHETNVPLYYEKNEIGTPGSFFSKQIILGPSKDYSEGNSYHPHSSYPYGDAYYQPEYSSYPQVYPYGGSSSYLYAADGHSSPGYSSYPHAQANYNYRPVYSPGYYYQQGHGYYPVGGNYRSNRDLSTQFQRYQDELDSVLSQFFRADSVGGEASSANFGNNSTVDQLTGDIEREEKKIKTLQEELKTPQGSNHGSGVSQSFVKWLSEEIDTVYSKWIHLKDDITKTKHDSEAIAKHT